MWGELSSKWDELSSECGASCPGASFLWGELSWGELSLGRVVRNPSKKGHFQRTATCKEGTFKSALTSKVGTIKPAIFNFSPVLSSFTFLSQFTNPLELPAF